MDATSTPPVATNNENQVTDTAVQEAENKTENVVAVAVTEEKADPLPDASAVVEVVVQQEVETTTPQSETVPQQAEAPEPQVEGRYRIVRMIGPIHHDWLREMRELVKQSRKRR